MYLKILLFLCCLPLLSIAQFTPPTEAYPYKLSHELDKESSTSSHLYFHNKAFQYACIGQYEKALQAWDQFAQPKEELEEQDKTAFQALLQRDARSYIAEQADNNDIVIFNEYRHLPIHRSFTLSMLSRLYSKGYRYLAIDVIPFENDSLNEIGYVNVQTEGDEHYLADPLYSDLIRRAIRLGFEILPMHVSEKEVPVGEQARAMVRSIHRAVRKDSEAKIIVHTNYPQAMKVTPKGWDGTLYYYLKLLTRNGVLSIDQASMTAHSQPEFENPYYRLSKLSAPAVFVSHTGKAFVEPSKADLFDVQIFQPRTSYNYNRPDWMQLNGARKPYLLDFKRFGISSFPCFVQAFAADETGQYIVPVDQVEVEKGPYYSRSSRKMVNQTSLYLPNGRIRLIIRSPYGKVLHDDFITL